MKINKLFLVNVPAFKVDRYEKIVEASKGIITESKPKLSPNEIFEDKSALVYCKFCKIAFLKNEVWRIVTMKMISELRGHYNKRGIFKFDHFTRFKDTKRTCKVCELWYMIVIAEHELMKTELKFALSQGIPVHEERDQKAKVLKSNSFKSEDFKNKLKQWRIMYYFGSCYEVDMIMLDKLKRPNSKLYLQLKMFEYITKFEIKYPKLIAMNTQIPNECSNLWVPMIPIGPRVRRCSKYEGRNYNNLITDELEDSFEEDEIHNKTTVDRRDQRKMKVEINKIRVHFFFTEFMDISDFVKNTEVEIRVTDGPDWNRFISTGKAKPFESMDPTKDDIVQTDNKSVYLFSKKMDEFFITMKCGIKFDKDIQTENLGLSLYNGVYFPDNHYYNSDALPIEWLEIFEKKEYLIQIEEKSEITDVFDPNCTKRELDYAKEPWSFLNKTIFKMGSEKQLALKKTPSVDFIKLNKNLSKNPNKQSKVDQIDNYGIQNNGTPMKFVDELKASYHTARNAIKNELGFQNNCKNTQFNFQPIAEINSRTKLSQIASIGSISTKFSRFFKSRNRPEGYRSTGEVLAKTIPSENSTKELPAKKFLKSICNSNELKTTGSKRPASAIEHKPNSYTRISESNSKDSFLEAAKDVKAFCPDRTKPHQYEIPEKYRGKMCKRKKHKKFKKKPKPHLWQYTEDQVKFLKDKDRGSRPVSARLIFHNNVSKKKELQQLFELVKRPNDLSNYNSSKWGLLSKRSKSVFKNRPQTSHPSKFAQRNLSAGRKFENSQSEFAHPNPNAHNE